MSPSRTRRALKRLSLAVVVAGGVIVASIGSVVPASAASKTPDLSGVTVNFGDLFKEYQTLIAATNTLHGAPYKVSFSEFTSGPPIVAAETGGSVDLGAMAETPTIFGQAANDPLKVVAALQGTSSSDVAILVAPHSSIKEVADLRGKTIAVQEGTVEQYFLIQALEEAGVPYSAVTIDNLTITAGEAALESGRVDAWVGSQPLNAIVTQAGKGKVLTDSVPGSLSLEYLVASQSALDNPKKAAAISNFVVRLSKSEDILRNDPTLAAETYVKTYGVSLAVAKAAVASTKFKQVPLSSSIIKYQQKEADEFQKIGLVSKKLDVAKVFDLPLNKSISAAAGVSSK